MPTVDLEVEPLTDAITINTPSLKIPTIDGLVADLPPNLIDTQSSSSSLSGHDYMSSSIFFISRPHPHLRPPTSAMWADIIGSGGGDSTPGDGDIIIVDSCSGGLLPSCSHRLELWRSGSPPFIEEGDVGAGPICDGTFPSCDGVADWAAGSAGEMVSVSIARAAVTLEVPLSFQGGVNLGQQLPVLPTTSLILGPVTGAVILLGLYGDVAVASATGWVHVASVPGVTGRCCANASVVWGCCTGGHFRRCTSGPCGPCFERRMRLCSERLRGAFLPQHISRRYRLLPGRLGGGTVSLGGGPQTGRPIS